MSYDGRLEKVVDGRAFGWACDRSNMARNVELEIRVDGVAACETVADLLRPTLAQDGVGDGRHAFVVELPVELSDGCPHSISVLLPTGEPLREPGVFESADGAVFRNALEMRPSHGLQFSRRMARAGFTGIDRVETVVLADETKVKRPSPVLFAVLPGVGDPQRERACHLDQGDDGYLAPRPLVSRLPNGIVDTASFMICPNERRYLFESVRHHASLSRWGYRVDDDLRLERTTDGAVIERPERVVVIGGQNNPNYFHWLLKSVARALLFRSLDDGMLRYLVPPLCAFQRGNCGFAGHPGDPRSDSCGCRGARRSGYSHIEETPHLCLACPRTPSPRPQRESTRGCARASRF